MTSPRVSLVAVQNVWNSALRVLKARGYNLSLTCSRHPEVGWVERVNHLTWLAEKDGYQLVAGNPIELLGLAGVFEFQVPKHNEPYWWVVEGEDLMEQLLSTIGLGLEGRKGQP